MKHSAPAFSLLELIVSVAVIALLGGLILPAVQAARNSGAAARSSGQLRQLATANLSYLFDNGTFAPGSDRANQTRWHGKRVGRSGGSFDPTQGYLSPYLGKSRTISICPLLPTHALKGASFEQGLWLQCDLHRRHSGRKLPSCPTGERSQSFLHPHVCNYCFCPIGRSARVPLC